MLFFIYTDKYGNLKTASNKVHTLHTIWQKFQATITFARWKMTTRPPLSPVARRSPLLLNSTQEMISAEMSINVVRIQQHMCIFCQKIYTYTSFKTTWAMLRNFLEREQFKRFQPGIEGNFSPSNLKHGAMPCPFWPVTCLYCPKLSPCCLIISMAIALFCAPLSQCIMA